jgi:hypothetical protein
MPVSVLISVMPLSRCDYRFLNNNDLWNTNHVKAIKEKGGEDYFDFMLSNLDLYNL